MITSRQELQNIINADYNRNGKPSFSRWISMNDNYLPTLLLKHLRHTEYWQNNRKKLFGLGNIPYIWHMWNLRRLRIKTNIMIFPNTLGAGIQLMHPGFRRIDTMVKIGTNCTILPMVLFGNKRPDIINNTITVGDNCYISTGATILGPVKIGNNVTIGAGAVVVKDIPDNCIVGGVPAKVLYFK